MKRQQLLYVGQRIFELRPDLAAMIVAQFENVRVLQNLDDIGFLSATFSEYYGISFPKGLPQMPINDSTDYRIKFTAFCLSCYDPDSLFRQKKIKNHLRQSIAEHLNTNPRLISQYVPRARVYMRAYREFSEDISRLVSVVRLSKVCG